MENALVQEFNAIANDLAHESGFSHKSWLGTGYYDANVMVKAYSSVMVWSGSHAADT